jgi:hypothetical protein
MPVGAAPHFKLTDLKSGRLSINTPTAPCEGSPAGELERWRRGLQRRSGCGCGCLRLLKMAAMPHCGSMAPTWPPREAASAPGPTAPATAVPRCSRSPIISRGSPIVPRTFGEHFSAPFLPGCRAADRRSNRAAAYRSAASADEPQTSSPPTAGSCKSPQRRRRFPIRARRPTRWMAPPSADMRAPRARRPRPSSVARPRSCRTFLALPTMEKTLRRRHRAGAADDRRAALRDPDRAESG